jgi:NADH pyrophosphatase NudC (nudix superfamily)
MNDPTLYQVPQKVILFSKDRSAVFLARRKGEHDYNGIYTFIGGKLEKTDGEILRGLKREKDEEIGMNVKLLICPTSSYNVYYVKTDGNHTLVPHYYAEFQSGKITLSDEYDDYKWVAVDEFSTFEPKIHNMTDIVEWALRLRSVLAETDFVAI